MFFQAVLLGGYLLAHVVGNLQRRRQITIYGSLLIASITVLVLQGICWPAPLLPPIDSSEISPTLRVTGQLAVSVGLPFLLLSTTGPLVQHWFANRFPDRSPYPLYAVSNAGSLLGLLLFPLVLEPALGIRHHAMIWSCLFILYAIQIARLLTWRSNAPIEAAKRVAPVSSAPVSSKAVPAADTMRLAPSWGWISLSALGSALLLAVTNQVSVDLAQVPLLWALVLAMYLLSFMAVFSKRSLYNRKLLGTLLYLLTPFAAWMLLEASSVPIGILVPGWCLWLFVATTCFHGELERRKPDTNKLTAYYLAISAGGALGGTAIAIAAPLLFDDNIELPVLLVAVPLLFHITGRSAMNRSSRTRMLARTLPPALSTLICAVTVIIHFEDLSRKCHSSARNYYGTLHLCTGRINGMKARLMLHGNTTHGAQVLEPDFRMEPTTYYTASTGAGLALRLNYRRREDKPIHVGVVGLGVGTVAAYGRTGDVFEFYEIDPAVIESARKDFTFLAGSAAECRVHLGDGRLVLEHQLRAGSKADLDVLVIDAFSSDSIPVHLLTREAFSVYMQRLAPAGVLAFHVSNRYMEIERVVSRLADDAGLPSLYLDNEPDPFGLDSLWVLVTKDESFIESMPDYVVVRRPGPGTVSMCSLWTDDYSNVLEIIDFFPKGEERRQ